ncbi:MAG: aldehyde-activating protein, partial [Planctomycetota bacterium]
RCPKCQVAVWSNYLVFGNQLGEHVRFIRVGTLDNSAAMPPDVNIFTESKHPWVILSPDTPAVKVYYVVADIWRPESLTRRNALEKTIEGSTNT